MGQSIALGENANPITREQLQAAFASGGENIDGIADSIADSAAADIEAEQGEAMAEEAMSPDWASMDDDQKLEHYINQMGNEPAAPEGEQTGEQTPDSESAADIPYVAKTGRLTVAKRLDFVGKQMLKGMQMWWQKNQVKIYAALIGILIGAGVIAFFTGGAGLIAILQILMQVMTAYFIANAILRIKGHVYDYLEKSWGGDTDGGGKSLAKALAILISEFVLEYLLKVVGKVLKRIKAALKGTKRMGKAMKKVSRVVRRVGTRAKVAGRKIKTVVLTKGKFIFTKLNKASMKVVNTIGDLRKKILNKFGFKRMWLEKSGKYVEVWADFNPKILLMRTDADGNAIDANKFDFNNADNFAEFDDAARNIMEQTGDNLSVGKRLNNGNVVVSDAYQNYFNKLDDKAKREALERLNSDTFDVRRTEALNGSRLDFDITAGYRSADEASDAIRRLDADQLEQLRKNDPERFAEYQRIRNEMDTNAGKRSDALTERNQNLEGTTEYNSKNHEVRGYSENIGEGAIDAHMKAKGYNTVHEGTGAYNLDRVYEKDGIFYVVEAKGGSSSLGGKHVTTRKGKEFAQQGTREYLEKTIGDLRTRAINTKDKKLFDTITDLEDQLKSHKIKYLHGQQKIKPDGSLGEFIMKEFDI